MSCPYKYCKEPGYTVTISTAEGRPVLNGQLFSVHSTHGRCGRSSVEVQRSIEDSDPDAADQTQQTQQTRRSNANELLANTSRLREPSPDERLRRDSAPPQSRPGTRDMEGMSLVDHPLQPPVHYPLFLGTELDPHGPYIPIHQYENQPLHHEQWTPETQSGLLIKEETEHQRRESNDYSATNGASTHERDDAEGGNEE